MQHFIPLKACGFPDSESHIVCIRKLLGFDFASKAIELLLLLLRIFLDSSLLRHRRVRSVTSSAQNDKNYHRKRTKLPTMTGGTLWLGVYVALELMLLVQIYGKQSFKRD